MSRDSYVYPVKTPPQSVGEKILYPLGLVPNKSSLPCTFVNVMLLSKSIENTLCILG